MVSTRGFDTREFARRLATLTLALWAVLVASGVYLIFGYRPTASASYSDIESLRSEFSLGLWIRRVHNFASIPALIAPIVLAGVHRDRSQLRAAAAALGAAATTGGLWITGRLLPWDQIALWAVTVGTNVIGYTPLFADDNVRFVLINGSEVTLESIRSWFLLHTILLPVLLMLFAVTYWFAGSRLASTTAHEGDKQAAID